MSDLPFLDSLIPVMLLFAMGIASATVSRMIGLSPILGYTALGFILKAFQVPAPFSILTVNALVQLGIMFLLFDIGLHFSLKEVRARARDIFAFGPVQVIFATVSLGTIAHFFGLPWLPSFLVGAVMSGSSTAVVARLIAERHQQSCPVGRTATAILIFQDMASILLLIIVGSIGTDSGVAVLALQAMGKAAVAFFVAIIASKWVVRPLMVLVASSRYEEVFTATALLVALAGGWLTGQVGLSLTLGAFLGGLTLSETPYRAVIQSEITPFRGLMLGFFFMYVGFSLDAVVLRQSWLAIVLIAAGLMVVKGLSNAGASILFKWSVPGSAQLGFLLAQGSEFAFVILNLPSVKQLVGAQQSSIIIAAIALTMAATPQVADLGRILAGYLRHRSRQDHNAELTPGAITAPVIIIGMGSLGRAVADAMIEFCIEYSAIEKDMPRLREAIADGYNVFLGNSSDLRLWESVDLKHRKVSVLTSPRLDELAFNHPVAKASYPNLKRIAAASDETMAAELRTIGITAVLERSPPIGLHLASAVLLELGVDAAEVDAWKRRRISSTPAPSTLVDMPLATN